mmetsp:Transcript_32830/g.103945  ORF Transcript_32830/g.103945 Transcript_32830/m.103945 type:complete len:274 (-) Transcript_32830:68-889(-)
MRTRRSSSSTPCPRPCARRACSSRRRASTSDTIASRSATSATAPRPSATNRFRFRLSGHVQRQRRPQNSNEIFWSFIGMIACSFSLRLCCCVALALLRRRAVAVGLAKALRYPRGRYKKDVRARGRIGGGGQLRSRVRALLWARVCRRGAQAQGWRAGLLLRAALGLRAPLNIRAPLNLWAPLNPWAPLHLRAPLNSCAPFRLRPPLGLGLDARGRLRPVAGLGAAGLGRRRLHRLALARVPHIFPLLRAFVGPELDERDHIFRIQSVSWIKA